MATVLKRVSWLWTFWVWSSIFSSWKIILFCMSHQQSGKFRHCYVISWANHFFSQVLAMDMPLLNFASLIATFFYPDFHLERRNSKHRFRVDFFFDFRNFIFASSAMRIKNMYRWLIYQSKAISFYSGTGKNWNKIFLWKKDK